MEKRKALIFDMDGTMFDTEPISYRFWREISARYGYDLDRTVFDQMLGRDDLRIKPLCEAAFGPDYPYEKVVQEKVAAQMEYYKSHDIPFKPGLNQILEYARKEGLICAVASSSPREMIEYLLERNGLASFFRSSRVGKKRRTESRRRMSSSWPAKKPASSLKRPWSWKIRKAEFWPLIEPGFLPFGFPI